MLLHHEEPTTKFWSHIEQLDQVYFVRGTPLEQVDLHRCNIEKGMATRAHATSFWPRHTARSFIVLHDGEGDEDVSSVGLRDWKAILSVLAATEKSNVPVCAELIHGENVKFFPGCTEAGEMYTLSMPFAAGRVWTTALMDSILVLPYYERHLLKVLERLSSGRSAC